MATNKNNQKISEIKQFPSYTEFKPSHVFYDPGLIEPKTLFMISQTFSGHRKTRSISTRYTYDQLYKYILTSILQRASTYTFKGTFNFATRGVKLYCKNSPAGRRVINYGNCKTWFEAKKGAGGSGFDEMFHKIGYAGDNTNSKYDPS